MALAHILTDEPDSGLLRILMPERWVVIVARFVTVTPIDFAKATAVLQGILLPLCLFHGHQLFVDLAL